MQGHIVNMGGAALTKERKSAVFFTKAVNLCT
jgi:hypothetical protein